MNNIFIDIDGTVSEVIPLSEGHRFINAKVLDGAVSGINRLFDSGNIITFVTIRPESFRAITESWLKTNGIKYSYLIMNKPRASNYYWINNLNVHGIKYNNNWSSISDKFMLEKKVSELKVTKQEPKYNSIYDLQGGVNYII